MNFGSNTFRSCLTSLGLICLMLFASAAEGNAKKPKATSVASLGHPFDLKAGGQVTLNGGKLRIKFVAVQEDSRCPADVTCVWAGNAAVRLVVSTNRNNERSRTLNTSKTSSLSREVEYQGYQIQLVLLKPYPRSAKKIAASDYTVTLFVIKLSTPASGKKPSQNFLTAQLIIADRKGWSAVGRPFGA